MFIDCVTDESTGHPVTAAFLGIIHHCLTVSSELNIRSFFCFP